MPDKHLCYHCGNKLPQNQVPITVEVKNVNHAVCCLGCKSVTEHIYKNGLGTYYQFRSDLATKPEKNINVDQYEVFDDVGFLEQLSTTSIDKPENRNIVLSVDNIHCAACAWLIEQSLLKLPGVEKVNVNTINQRANICWNTSQCNLSSVLAKLASIGYPSTPFNVTETEHKIKDQEKQYIKRLGVAGLFTMQVMMLAFAMYFGAFKGMEAHQLGYFKWISLLLSVPVIFYSALPFLFGAFYALKAKRLNMDVPVALAIYGAFFASFYQLLVNGLDGNKGEVFFESISMFTFLLLIGKYLEFKAKSKAILSNANLHKNIPISIHKLINGQPVLELVKNIQINDLILLKPGQNIAVDGVITEGSTSVNESVLNGEFEPINKLVGDAVLAGSINNDGIITVKVTAIGPHTTLSKIGLLQEEFSLYKPLYTQFADKVAHWFVFSQLILAALTYLYWYFVEPTDALWISLSVLVATCPCALSLATPTAYTCVISTLNKQGILIKDPLAFDKLNHLTHVCFDKTGTLTKGIFVIQDTFYHNDSLAQGNLNQLELLQLVQTLQEHSEHPISKAFTSVSLGLNDVKESIIKINNITVVIGSGISGDVKGQELKVGSYTFCNVNDTPTVKNANVFVSYGNKIVAEFYVSDQLKPESMNVIQDLKYKNIQVAMLTGDSSAQAIELAHELELDTFVTGALPKQKAEFVTHLQLNNKSNLVCMVGDGINDSPVFAASDVSIAMGDGADVTKNAADIIILKGNLLAITTLINASKQTKNTIKSNLYWSLIYNLFILPVAMMGLVSPYIAVLGMSASSILVVTNSLRLLKVK